MFAVIEKSKSSEVLGSGIHKFIENIAKDAGIKDYQIEYLKQIFTGDNYLGEISRVKIIPSDSNEKTIHLLLKKAPADELSRKTMPVKEVYDKEIYTYSNILPSLYELQVTNDIPIEERFTYATFYNSTSKDGEEVIVMKDLSPEGFVMRNKRIPYDYDHALLVITNLARLHATSFALKAKEPELYAKYVKAIETDAESRAASRDIFIKMCLANLKCVTCPVNRARMDKFGENLYDVVMDCMDPKLAEPYAILCHGDCWNNNMLFKYQEGKVEEVILIDWQVIRYASPVTDLSYAVCTSMDPELMETRLDELMDLYHDTLGSNLSKMGCDIEQCFPRKVFDDHFKRFMKFGLGVGLVIIPLVLVDKENAKGLANTLEDYKQGDESLSVNNLASDRVNGVVNYFVKHDLC